MDIERRPIGQFLDAIAAGTPTPGGGSTAAVAGAAAAALCEMVGNLTRQADGDEVDHANLEALQTTVGEERSRLLELATEDSEAFERAVAAARTGDLATTEASLQEAATVPLEIAEVCASVLEAAVAVAEIGEPNAVTDASIAALLAHAGVHSALDTVAINLTSISDAQFSSATRERIEELRARADTRHERSRDLLEARCALELSER